MITILNRQDNICNLFILLLFVFAFKAFCEEPINLQKTLEPPSGKGQFYVGLGLTLGAIPMTIFGLLAINDKIFIEGTPTTVEVNGIPVDTLSDSTDFTPLSKALGVTAFIAAGIFEAVGIPMLVIGNNKRKVHKNWEIENNLTFKLKIRKEISSFMICYDF